MLMNAAAVPVAMPVSPTRTRAAGTEELLALFALPFPELMDRARVVHRANFPTGDVELASLLSIKTGGCPEDCGYCPQAARYHTGVEADKLMPLEEVVDAARAAQAAGATRFCMGAAWRQPQPRHLARVAEMVQAVRALGLQTCATLGMLEEGQAEQLRDAGLDYYNHNLDTDSTYYGDVITTRQYQDRLDTLQRVREAGLKVCCGGIVGMGESRVHRAGLIAQLAQLDPYPESVPINRLVRVAGTPLADADSVEDLEFVRTIAVARIAMPRARIRLSAGREQMNEALQTLCVLAGANSVFYGERLLTRGNPQVEADRAWFARLGVATATR